MKYLFLLAACAVLMSGCVTERGGTTTETGTLRGGEADTTTSDFGRGEGWRNTWHTNAGAVRDPRPAGGFHQ